MNFRLQALRCAQKLCERVFLDEPPGPMADRSRWHLAALNSFSRRVDGIAGGARGTTMAEVNILLVEDDEVDVTAVKRALKELKIANPFHRAADGIDALEMLRGANGKKMVPQPLIILLDLNMPRMGGMEFLDQLRKDPNLRHSIVFVMTTSAAEEDRVRAYNRCIAGYILKHSTAHTFLEAVTMLDHFWRVIEFPERC
jgi:CheY-like chemotaxis protein